MSLLTVVKEWEARHLADETGGETSLKQTKQLFHQELSQTSAVKHGEPQKSAVFDACFTVSPLRARNSETELPAELGQGLAKLRSGWSPNVIEYDIWREIVADALALRDAGWAAAALALGWSPLDLFGHSDRRDGLAIWLRRRPILLIDAAFAMVDNGDGVRGGYYRCRDGMPGATLLWEIGQ